MAKITVIGNAIVISSSKTLDEIKMIEEYEPTALALCDSKSGDIVFKVGIGSGDMNKYGVAFDSVSRDGENKATLTVLIPEDVTDAQSYVVGKYAYPLAMLDKIEKHLDEVIEDIEEEKQNIMSMITIA